MPRLRGRTRAPVTDPAGSLVPVRLKLGKRDKIRHVLQPSSDVLISRAATAVDDDPVVGKILQFLADDLAKHPQNARGLSAGLRTRIRSLVAGTKVDRDARLDPRDE